LPDPGDPEKRKALLEKIGGRVVKEQIEKKDPDGKTISEEKVITLVQRVFDHLCAI